MLSAPVAVPGVAPTPEGPTAEGEFGALLASMTGAPLAAEGVPTATPLIGLGRISAPPVEAAETNSTIVAEEVLLNAMPAQALVWAAPTLSAEGEITASDAPVEAEAVAATDDAPDLAVPTPIPAGSTPSSPPLSADTANSAAHRAAAAPDTADIATAPAVPAATAAAAAGASPTSEAVEGAPVSVRPSASDATHGSETAASSNTPAQARAEAAVIAALPHGAPAPLVPSRLPPRGITAPVAVSNADAQSLEDVQAVGTSSSRSSGASVVEPTPREQAPSIADRASGRMSETPPASATSAGAAQTAPTPPTGAILPATPAVAAPVIDALAVAAPLADSTAAPTPNAAPAAAASFSATSLAATVGTSLSTLSQTVIEATAQIAAQITRRLEGRSTRFEMALSPEGLGRVDVSLDIDADGQLSARLAFDNPLAATDLRGRADELRRQLEDAGFTLARDALDFAERDASSSGQGFDRRQGRAFAEASRRNDDADAAIPAPAAWISLSLTPQGVDMKV